MSPVIPTPALIITPPAPSAVQSLGRYPQQSPPPLSGPEQRLQVIEGPDFPQMLIEETPSPAGQDRKDPGSPPNPPSEAKDPGTEGPSFTGVALLG